MSTPSIASKDFDEPSDLVPTPEQAAIIAAAQERSESILVRAYAGCAKTTTLELIAKALPQGGLALAFNVKIKKELEKRFPASFTIKTMNGLGHSAWGAALGKRLTLDEKKLGRIVTAVMREANYSASADDWAVVKQLAQSAMTQGLVPREFTQKGLVEDKQAFWDDLATDLLGSPDDTLCGFARQAIIANVKEGFAGTISFDDQIYLSTMFGGRFPRFPLVMVDEAQDLSPLNHVQVRKCASDRLIVVGDEKQAIYSFRGADTASISKLRALRPEWIELPLATTFRCPRRLVTRQRGHVPDFKAFHANTEGDIFEWNSADEPAQRAWGHQKLFGLGHTEIAVLCRNNAPLLSLAFKLLRKQIGVTMIGRDIGKGLILLSKKIIPDDNTNAEGCFAAISAWRANESAKAVATGHDERLDAIEDKAESLLAILEGSAAQSARGLRARLGELFARDSGRVVLSTGHRAKGLEWDLVVHLDPWRVPSKWATRAAQKGDLRAMEQELNLRYVIETRAKRALALANLEDFDSEMGA